jgi:hypothetical protein
VKELSNQVQDRRALIEGLGKTAKELFEPFVEGSSQDYRSLKAEVF